MTLLPIVTILFVFLATSLSTVVIQQNYQDSACTVPNPSYTEIKTGICVFGVMYSIDNDKIIETSYTPSGGDCRTIYMNSTILIDTCVPTDGIWSKYTTAPDYTPLPASGKQVKLQLYDDSTCSKERQTVSFPTGKCTNWDQSNIFACDQNKAIMVTFSDETYTCNDKAYQQVWPINECFEVEEDTNQLTLCS
mmetsp:Transcript_5115/g.5562  ORF Transcript_5115/g.5562 Transcript_5115/m.5562 type:complete len:193 (-) Transcript_5115:38-616(-)